MLSPRKPASRNRPAPEPPMVNVPPTWNLRTRCWNFAVVPARPVVGESFGREREVARNRGIVPDAAIDRERLVKIRELLGAETEAVLLGITVVLFAMEVTDADIDARVSDFEA